MHFVGSNFLNERSVRKSATTLLIIVLLGAMEAHAENTAFNRQLQQGEAAERRDDAVAAFKSFTNADNPPLTNAAELCLLTRCYCDLAHLTNSKVTGKELAQRALDCAERAVKADPKSATAHLCVAVSYVKNFPYADNSTKVKWSRAIKSESETAIALDPKQDVGYYLLGRWNHETADMSLVYRGLVKVIYGGLPHASDADAIKDFKQAIELAPNRVIHHAELAKVYLAVGNKPLALAELKKCDSLKPTDRDDEAGQKIARATLAQLTK